MTTKNSNNDILSSIALAYGYDPCKKYPANDSFWTNNAAQCDPGFVTNTPNEYCYIALPTLENLDDGVKHCKSNYDAQLVLFNTNVEVNELIKLIESGNEFSKVKFGKWLTKH